MKKLFITFSLLLSFIGYSQNWQLVSTNFTEEIKDMYFNDESIGYAVAGQGKILKTIDGGLNWNLIYENSELFQEQSIVTLNNKVYCFAQNFDGVIKKLEFQINLNNFEITTINLNFTPQNPISYNNVIYDSGVKYENSQFIPLVGTTDISGSTISNGSSEIYKYDDNLTASDGHNIFYSTNGLIWVSNQFHTPFLTSGPYQSYYDGTSKMRTVTNYPCVVHISNDNGLSWTYNEINIQALYFYFVNAEKVLGLHLFNEENKIYYSTNSGITFDFETVTFPVKKIYAFSNNLSFAYGTNGVIYRSINAGGLLNTINEKKNENDLKIYPNPSFDEVIIEYNAFDVKINSISLYDINMKMLKNFKSDSKLLVLNNLRIGTYFIIFETNKGKITKKIIRK